MSDQNSKFSRRQFLKAAAVSAAAGLMPGLLPRPLYAAADAPETTKAILGFIALTDAAPLIVAKEKGMFAKYGMPELVRMLSASLSKLS